MLLHDNYLESLNANSISSENSSFPEDNLYDFARRSKVWRSGGYWIIAGGSNTIIFQESAGVNLTATITPGTYTTNAALHAAIKTALQAVGASTYTITHNTATHRVTIVSGGGGGRIFRLMWTNVSSAAMAAILGFSTGADDTGALTYTADVIRGHTEEWVKWDLGQSQNPKAFILIGTRTTPVKISATATVKLQGNGTDVWTSPEYDETLTYDQACMGVLNADGIHTQALRYWRLSIVDTDNPYGYVEIGLCYLGDAFIAERGGIQFPYEKSVEDRTVVTIAENGYAYSDIREKADRFSLSWFGLTNEDKEDLEDIFDDFGTGTALFFALDPDAVFGSSFNRNVKFARFLNPPSAQLVSPAVWSMRMDFREEL